MTWRDGTTMVAAIALACLVSGGAAAQDRTTDTMEVLREKVRADKKITHYDRVAKLLDDYAKAYPSITDETATRLLGEFLALESNHAALLTRWAPRFEQVLPPRKVARFYQVENKIRALLSYELARDIPLVK
jgi:hypothetical protein